MGKRKQTKPLRPSRTSRAAVGRSSDAIRLMRQRNLSLTAAAKLAGTTPKTIIRYARDQLSKQSTGRYRARARGQMVRRLRFLTPEGQIVVTVRSAKTASLIAKYSAAVENYLKTGGTERLNKCRGKSIRVGKKKYEFVTDPKALRRLAAIGEVSFEDLYADVT